MKVQLLEKIPNRDLSLIFYTFELFHFVFSKFIGYLKYY